MGHLTPPPTSFRLKAFAVLGSLYGLLAIGKPLLQIVARTYDLKLWR